VTRRAIAGFGVLLVLAVGCGSSSDPKRAVLYKGQVSMTGHVHRVSDAEAKATATLAAAGVTGGVLYNLVHAQTQPSLALDIVVTINALMIIASGGSAVMALIPRLAVRKAKPGKASTSAIPRTSTSGTLLPENPVNLLFFRDIARHYRGDAPTYTQVLRTLTSDPERLTEYISQQVHANSDVAHRKYGWANRAALSLAFDLLSLAITAGLVARH